MYLLELNDQIESAKNQIQEAKKLVDTKQDELKQLEDKAWFCRNCSKYYPKDIIITSIETATQCETVYTDAGYGDDDEIADVTRQYTCIQCPVCGKTQRASTKGQYMYERNRRKRRG